MKCRYNMLFYMKKVVTYNKRIFINVKHHVDYIYDIPVEIFMLNQG